MDDVAGAAGKAESPPDYNSSVLPGKWKTNINQIILSVSYCGASKW